EHPAAAAALRGGDARRLRGRDQEAPRRGRPDPDRGVACQPRRAQGRPGSRDRGRARSRAAPEGDRRVPCAPPARRGRAGPGCSAGPGRAQPAADGLRAAGAGRWSGSGAARTARRRAAAAAAERPVQRASLGPRAV
ncbi:MAG: hypothetical protein AVDCRST_MAG85-1770, partial [uncultured Solirubrobacteraceae bacterium]